MKSITLLKHNSNFVKMKTITISGMHFTIFALASSAQSWLVFPNSISLQLASCTSIALVFINFIDVLWLLKLSILLSVLCSTVRHFQLINSCQKFSLHGVSTMKDAFLANDLYWNFLHLIGVNDIPKYSKNNFGFPGTQAHFSSLLLTVFGIIHTFRVYHHIRGGGKEALKPRSNGPPFLTPLGSKLSVDIIWIFLNNP